MLHYAKKMEWPLVLLVINLQ